MLQVQSDGVRDVRLDAECDDDDDDDDDDEGDH